MNVEVNFLRTGGYRVAEGKDFKFDHTASYFPVSGKLEDKFDKNFKLVINMSIDEATTFFLAISWKGTNYLIVKEPIDCTNYPCSGTITVTWKEGEEPTIKELLENLEEPIPTKTTAYSYSWITGYLTNETEGVKTDQWDAELLVEIPSIPWHIIIPVAAIGVTAAGIAIAMSKK